MNILSNKKLISAIIIIGIIFITSIFLTRFGDQYFDFMTPPGIGTLNSSHDDFKLKIILDSQQLDLDVNLHPELLYSNPYIFYDSNNWIHRVATGATLEFFLQSIGIELENNCMILKSEFVDIFGEPLKQTEYCDDSQIKLRMYSSEYLTDFDILSYVPNDDDRLVLVYDDIGDESRSFFKYHHKELIENPELLQPDHQD